MAKPSRASARGREALLAKARRRRSGGDAAKAAIDLNLKESLVVRDSSASNHLRGCGVAVRSGSGRGSFHLVLAVGLSVGGPRLLFKRFASSTKLDGLPRR